MVDRVLEGVLGVADVPTPDGLAGLG